MKIADDTTFRRLASCWPLILLVSFATPFLHFSPILGYRWPSELAIAVFIFFTALSTLVIRASTKIAAAEFKCVLFPLVLFIGWSFASLLWSSSWRAALHHSLLWSGFVCFYVLIRKALDDETKALMLKVLGGVVCAVSVSCLIEYLGRDEAWAKTFNERYYTFAEAVVTLIPIFLAARLTADRKWSRLAFVVTALAWAAVVATTSRTMLMAGLFGMAVFVIFAWLSHGRFEKPRRLVVTMIALLAIMILVQLPLRSGEYASTITRLAEADQSSAASTNARFLMWGIAIEGFRSDPIVGIGADNYFADYKILRESFSSRDPKNPLLEVGEEFIPERAHNELLQILAELGIVGALLFGWLLVGIAYLFWLAFKKKASVLTVGALSGMLAFLVASGASSYSFRFPANGLCFFFLLAFASRELFDSQEDETPSRAYRLVPIFGIVVSVAMVPFCLVRANSIRHMTNAINAKDEKVRTAEIKNAIAIDPSEPMFRFYYGQWLASEDDYEAAIPQLRLAIDNGLANSTSLFRLAVAQQRAGMPEEAESTLQEALRVYPRSVFLRTAYAAFLKRKGDGAAAEANYNTALAINEKQARSWQLAHDEGLERLVQVSRVDPSYVTPFDLIPGDGPLALTQ